MQHCVFLLYVLAFAGGTVSITVALLFYMQYQRKVIIYYALFLGVVAAILVSRMLGLYASLTGCCTDRGIALAGRILDRIAYGAGLFTAPYFVSELIGIPLGTVKKRIFFGLGVLFIVMTAVELAMQPAGAAESIRLWISMPLLFGVYAYLLALGAVYLGKVGNHELNIALKVFFILSVIALPFAFYQYISGQPYLPYFLENAASYLFLTVASIAFSFLFFNQPPYLDKSGLSEYFRKKFAITARESEIISLLLTGSTNAQIGEKLFISTRTVESHLYSIFQKACVKNRVQLINLIQTNRK